ncbi:MAG: AAA family ATPase, partial [Oscillospiraceae bacterium]|nr:AAA family ATPase [Oscillospiraceae bacterium]
SSYGTVLLFAGPPGVGKTSVAKTIAEAMGRPFAKVSLAGVSEAGVIKGTSTIYSNCRHGKIVDALINTQSFCPVILLDEVDKVSRGLNGTGDPQYALLDILDSDRSRFIDECLGIPIDLSNVIFIATANDMNNISPILMDRFDVIELEGYNPEEKFGIAKDYLLRDMYAYYGLSPEDISIEADTIRYIISRFSTEAGVRNLSKTLRQIFEEVVYCKEMSMDYNHLWNNADVDNFFDLEGIEGTWK